MDGFNAVLEGQSSTYGTMISVIIVSSFTLFILYRGYQTLAGKLRAPVEDVVWDMGRMLLITTFALNRDGWLDMAVAAIQDSKTVSAAMITSGRCLIPSGKRHRHWGRHCSVWTPRLTSN